MTTARGRGAAAVAARRWLAMATVATVLAVAAPAAADPWGDTEDNQVSGVGSHPDGSTHSWCLLAIPASTSDNRYNAIRHAMTQAVGAQTQAVNEFKAPCDASGEYRTDTAWRDDYLGGGTRGRATCIHWSDSGAHCDQSLVQIDALEIAKGSSDYNDMQKTACHEAGHTVGLTHHADRISTWGCMINGEIPSTSSTWRYYGQHHKDHINAWF
ncbi:hypothetical protein ACJ5H2_20850 [Nocardioides sp. R1-1]|uniref:hypothetical protein n=1 Tax=Nocardioides sp. R1-1 TaxID=3383502 RepID=UPI0038CFC079